MKDRHTYTPGVILVSKITWKNLKKEYQDALVQAAKETQEYNRTAIEEADQKLSLIHISAQGAFIFT